MTPKNTNNNVNNANNENKGVKPNGFSVVIDNYTDDVALKQSIKDFIGKPRKRLSHKNLRKYRGGMTAEKADNNT